MENTLYGKYLKMYLMVIVEGSAIEVLYFWLLSVGCSEPFIYLTKFALSR